MHMVGAIVGSIVAGEAEAGAPVSVGVGAKVGLWLGIMVGEGVGAKVGLWEGMKVGGDDFGCVVGNTVGVTKEGGAVAAANGAEDAPPATGLSVVATAAIGAIVGFVAEKLADGPGEASGATNLTHVTVVKLYIPRQDLSLLTLSSPSS